MPSVARTGRGAASAPACLLRPLGVPTPASPASATSARRPLQVEPVRRGAVQRQQRLQHRGLVAGTRGGVGRGAGAGQRRRRLERLMMACNARNVLFLAKRMAQGMRLEREPLAPQHEMRANVPARPAHGPCLSAVSTHRAHHSILVAIPRALLRASARELALQAAGRRLCCPPLLHCSVRASASICAELGAFLQGVGAPVLQGPLPQLCARAAALPAAATMAEDDQVSAPPPGQAPAAAGGAGAAPARRRMHGAPAQGFAERLQLTRARWEVDRKALVRRTTRGGGSLTAGSPLPAAAAADSALELPKLGIL